MIIQINKYIVLICLFFILGCTTQKASVQSDPLNIGIFKVKDFGAKPNDGKEDTDEIIACLAQAAQNGGTVVLEPGEYSVSSSLLVTFNGSGRKLTIEGNGATIKATKFIPSILDIRSANVSQNDLIIKNLTLDGNTLPSARSALFDGTKWQRGLNTKDLKTVTVSNTNIQNIYGNGITIYFHRYTDSSQIDAPEFFSIVDTKILNCSGLKPNTDPAKKSRSWDHYGDGIYIRGGKNGEVKNCEVHNNLDVVGKVGRAGIALTAGPRDVIVEGNTIKGYDRGIHIELTYGGHILDDNDISDCNLGIIASASKKNYITNNPLIIKNNKIQGTDRDRAVYRGVLSKQALIEFYLNSTLFEGSKIENNTLIDYGKTERHFIMIIHQKGIYMDNNKIKGNQSESGSVYIEKKLRSFTGNEISDLYRLYLRQGAEVMSDNKLKNITQKIIK